MEGAEAGIGLLNQNQGRACGRHKLEHQRSCMVDNVGRDRRDPAIHSRPRGASCAMPMPKSRSPIASSLVSSGGVLAMLRLARQGWRAGRGHHERQASVERYTP